MLPSLTFCCLMLPGPFSELEEIDHPGSLIISASARSIFRSLPTPVCLPHAFVCFARHRHSLLFMHQSILLISASRSQVPQLISNLKPRSAIAPTPAEAARAISMTRDTDPTSPTHFNSRPFNNSIYEIQVLLHKSRLLQRLTL